MIPAIPFSIKIKSSKSLLDSVFCFKYTSYRNANIHKMFSRGETAKIGGFIWTKLQYSTTMSLPCCSRPSGRSSWTHLFKDPQKTSISRLYRNTVILAEASLTHFRSVIRPGCIRKSFLKGWDLPDGQGDRIPGQIRGHAREY